MKVLTVLLVAVALATLGPPIRADATMPVPAVTPTRDGAHIEITAPVAGAVDYSVRRCMPDGTPIGDDIDFFGRAFTRAGSAPQIRCDITGLTEPAWFIVQTNDTIGPFPGANLLDVKGQPVFPDAPKDEDSIPFYCSGPTYAGFTSSNGQGNPHNAPRVIATSAPFLVTPIGGRPTGSNVEWWDGFASGSLSRTAYDPHADSATYVLTTPAGAYDVVMSNCDVVNSSVLVDYGRLHLIVLDGGTPGFSHQATHVEDGCILVSPQRIFAAGPGGLTIAFDGTETNSGRRWDVTMIAPADDPVTHPADDGRAVNRSNVFVRLDIVNDAVRTTIGAGYKPDGAPWFVHLTGASGQAPQTCIRPANGRGTGLASSVSWTASPNRFVFTEDGDRYTLTDKLLPYADKLEFLKLPLKVYRGALSYHQRLAMSGGQGPPVMAYWLGTGTGLGSQLWGFQDSWSGFGVYAAGALSSPAAAH